MARILIVFASHYGQTRKIAEHLGIRLRGLGHEVDVVDAMYARRGQPTPHDYDVVVLGSRIEAARHAPRIRDYISDHIDALRKVPSVFFSVSMSAAKAHAPADPNGYMDSMFAELGWAPAYAVALAGALPYRRYGFFTRHMMKAFARAAGHPTDTSRNHELTDWDRVDQLADRIATMTTPRTRAGSAR